MTTSSGIPAVVDGGAMAGPAVSKKAAWRTLAQRGVRSKPVRRKSSTSTLKVNLDAVDRMLGGAPLAEAEDSMIPDDAKPFDGATTSVDFGGNPAPTETPQPLPHDDLIPPSVALVAPDVTPNLRVPLEPSMAPKAPQPKSAVDVVLARTSPATPPTPPTAQSTAPAMSSAESMRLFGITPEAPAMPAASATAAPSSLQDAAYDPIAAATTPGIPMPEHKVNPDSLRSITEAARRFMTP